MEKEDKIEIQSVKSDASLDQVSPRKSSQMSAEDFESMIFDQ